MQSHQETVFGKLTHEADAKRVSDAINAQLDEELRANRRERGGLIKLLVLGHMVGVFWYFPIISQNPQQ